MTTTTYNVAGMTCGHCVSSVTEEVGKLPGVQNVEVDLVAGGRSKVTVSSDVELTTDQVRAAVDEAGYELTEATA
ncbi:cation transporter [Cellulomonas sp. ATA003]|uniref:heavy-metal-associated domain-containing protein n=1 Tax=Cellulomonas sp. ATA003 TaxID=3073064 RepID=UPI002873000D|nr:cation transporter [Cellulomonas sp. ATA003]WNB86997.1 cation transporter [Cellulomonas sp. ATA003]